MGNGGQERRPRHAHQDPRTTCPMARGRDLRHHGGAEAAEGGGIPGHPQQAGRCRLPVLRAQVSGNGPGVDNDGHPDDQRSLRAVLWRRCRASLGRGRRAALDAVALRLLFHPLRPLDGVRPLRDGPKEGGSQVVHRTGHATCAVLRSAARMGLRRHRSLDGQHRLVERDVAAAHRVPPKRLQLGPPTSDVLGSAPAAAAAARPHAGPERLHRRVPHPETAAHPGHRGHRGH